jgi:F0F1-type ATP synthase epsilon subunit
MFNVTFITPTSHKVVAVSWLECETPTGNLVIQTGHAPLITILKPYSEVRFENGEGVVEALEIPGGLAEIQRTSALIIVD